MPQPERNTSGLAEAADRRHERAHGLERPRRAVLPRRVVLPRRGEVLFRLLDLADRPSSMSTSPHLG